MFRVHCLIRSAVPVACYHHLSFCMFQLVAELISLLLSSYSLFLLLLIPIDIIKESDATSKPSAPSLKMSTRNHHSTSPSPLQKMTQTDGTISSSIKLLQKLCTMFATTTLLLIQSGLFLVQRAFSERLVLDLDLRRNKSSKQASMIDLNNICCCN